MLRTRDDLTFEQERDLLKQLQPYKDMFRATAWSSGFKYALTHPNAEKVLDADVASAEAHEGFNHARRWQQKVQNI